MDYNQYHEESCVPRKDPNEGVLDRLIAEGEARNWQDEPGTTITIAQVEMLAQLENIRNQVFRLSEKETYLPNRKRLQAVYTHVSAAVKRLKERDDGKNED